jgi:hypothetical protein
LLTKNERAPERAFGRSIRPTPERSTGQVDVGFFFVWPEAGLCAPGVEED